MIAHTPGPWTWNEARRAIYSEAGRVILAASATAICGRKGQDYYECGKPVANVHLTLKPDDGRLMAESPNLLAALRCLLEDAPPEMHAVYEARAAALVSRLDGDAP